MQTRTQPIGFVNTNQYVDKGFNLLEEKTGINLGTEIRGKAQKEAQNLFDNTMDKATGFIARQAQPYVDELLAQLPPKIERFGVDLTRDLVNMVIEQIPSDLYLNYYAQKIGNYLQKVVQENVLPQIYNRVGESIATGQFLDQSARSKIYNQIISSIPAKATFNIEVMGITGAINVNVRKVVQDGFTQVQFNTLLNKIAPFVESATNSVKTVAVQTGKNLAVFTILNSMIVGGILTLGYYKFYKSLD